MKLREIQNQLRQYLPLYTDRFNDWDDATYTVAGNTATIVTTNSHGLSVGSLVNIKDVVFSNPITGLASQNGTARAVTQIQHDLTQGFTNEIEISGANESQFNGNFSDITVLNRNIFEYDTIAYDDTTATGSPVLLEKNLIRYNGIFEVNNIVDANTYEITINGEADFSAVCKSASNASRITMAFDVEDAFSLYDSKDANDWWMFIIPGDTIVSKDRNADIDFNKNNNNDDYDQFVEKTATIMVIAKANNKVTPMDIIDECDVDIRNALLKTIVNWQPESTNSSEYSKTYFNGIEPGLFNNATYSHLYEISVGLRLRNDDVFFPSSAATRKFVADYRDSDTVNRQTIATDSKEFKEI